MTENIETPLQRAATAVGGVPKLAEALGISRPAIYQWDEIPADRVIAIERITGISRHDLRPDLHPRDNFSRSE
jgi:DNA-binding transcriptional regulator YdaS (Cro superfamily)